jgi:hypothetical protein
MILQPDLRTHVLTVKFLSADENRHLHTDDDHCLFTIAAPMKTEFMDLCGVIAARQPWNLNNLTIVFFGISHKLKSANAT